MYDLGEFDQKGTVRTKYGTKDEYLAAVKTLQAHKLAVIADIVFNHRMGADEKETVMAQEDNPDNREQDISSPEEIEAWTKFTFPEGKESTATFNGIIPALMVPTMTIGQRRNQFTGSQINSGMQM